jgi:hypothetical protein
MKNIKKLLFISITTTTLTLSSPTFCVTAEISCGELVDKITILMIKVHHISDKKKLKNILTELQSLLDTYDKCIGENNEIENLQKELQIINQQLWDIEDAIRIKEHKQEFYDDEFISLARSVYKTNDKRCALKKKIDTILHSRITEEKSYEEYVSNT